MTTTATTTASLEEKRAALHAATLSAVVHANAMRALEKLMTDDSGDISNKQSKKLIGLVDNLMADYPGDAENPAPECIDDAVLDELDAIFG